MAGILVGSARVAIAPDMSGFMTDLAAKVRTALASLDATVPVKFSIDAVSLAKARTALGPLAGENVPLKFSVDAASIAKARAAMGPLAGDTVPVKFVVDAASAAKARAAMGPLSGDTVPVRFQVDAASAAKARAALGPLAGDTVPVKFVVDSRGLAEVGTAASVVDATAARMAANMTRGATQMQAGWNAAGVAAELAAIKTKTFAVAAQDAADAQSELDAQLALGRLAAAYDTTAQDALTVSLGDAARAQHDLAGIGPLSTVKGGKPPSGGVLLFGGALKSLGVPAFLASAGAVHILADSVVELGSVLIPAGVALAAFSAAAVPSVQNIVLHMTALDNTSTALKRNIYPLTGGFSRMAAAVAPSVYTLFGEALVVANSKTGELTTLATGAGRALDTMGARAAAALTSGGLSAFLKNAPADLAKIGTVIGNVFGTVGNILHTLPGYGTDFLNVLGAVTAGVEHLTASPVVQWATGFALAAHGAVLWLGLASTAAVFLGNGLVTLASKFGLASAGALAFDAAQFGGGIKLMAGNVVNLGAALFTMSGAEDVAAASSGVLDGALMALDAVNPLVWIGAAAAGLAFLGFELFKSTTYINAYAAAAQSALEAAPVSQLGIDLTRQQAAVTSNLAGVQHNINTELPQTTRLFKQLFSGTKELTGAQAENLNTGLSWFQQRANDKALMPLLIKDEANYSAVLKAAGGNVSLLNGLGLTSNQIIGASASQLRQYQIEAQAAADAQRALGLGIGRAAAAQNAQTNAYMTDYLPAMQKVTAAEDAQLAAILGGRQGFLAFEQTITGVTAKLGTPPGLAAAAKVAGASMSGLNAASVNLSSNFYNDAVPAAQKLIDALDNQGISFKNLRTVIADEAKQMIPFVGQNTEARAVIVSLINNALGPGTVSLKTLNTWVKNNSGSLKGFNSIIAQSTIEAGTMAGVLKNELNAQFRADLLTTSGASGALKTYTSDLVHNRDQTTAGKADRARLITDLENAGLSAKQAAVYVDNLQTQIDKLHGKKIAVSEAVTAKGTYSVASSPGTVAGLGGNTGGATGKLAAAGMLVTGGVPGKDSVLINAMPGEVIVPVPLVNAGAVSHLHGKIPGYAAGGIAGSYAGAPAGVSPWLVKMDNATLTALEQAVARATLAGIKAASAKASLSAGNFAGHATSAQVAGWLSQAMGIDHEPASWAPYMELLISKESGGNPAAHNPSGASGIAQMMPATFGNWTTGGSIWNPVANLVASMRYIGNLYGSPANIPGLTSGNYVGYDNGGWLPPGLSLSANMTGEPERVLNASQLREATGGSGRGHGRPGPVMHVENATFNEPVDAALLQQQLSALITATGLG